MNLLLCTLLMAVAGGEKIPFQVQVERVNNTLVLSAPVLTGGEKYGEVWVEPPASLPPESLSPNSWRIASDATSGTFSVVVCGDGYCYIQECDWAAPLDWGKVGWAVAALALMAFFIIYIIKTCVEARP